MLDEISKMHIALDIEREHQIFNLKNMYKPNELRPYKLCITRWLLNIE